MTSTKLRNLRDLHYVLFLFDFKLVYFIFLDLKFDLSNLVNAITDTSEMSWVFYISLLDYLKSVSLSNIYSGNPKCPVWL